MLNAKPVQTPLATGATLSLHDGSKPSDAATYLQVLSSLQYLLLTRHDIVFVVNMLSQFMHTLTKTHWGVVKHLLRYLNGPQHYSLLLRQNSSLTLYCFIDADWVGNCDDRTSTRAFILLLVLNQYLGALASNKLLPDHL